MANFLDSIRPVTRHLLIINVLCLIATYALPKVGIDMNELFALHYWKASDFHIYQFVTYMFLHSGITHLFFNMFGLYMFGQVLEVYLKPHRFLFFYFFTGIGAAFIQELSWMYDLREFEAQVANAFATFSPEQGVHVPDGVIYSLDELSQWVAESYNNMLTVGASGAIFGILAAYAMLYPNQLMYVMFIPVPVKAKYVMIGYAIIELTSGVANFSGDNVAHFAHLGGALFGALLILLWRKQHRI